MAQGLLDSPSATNPNSNDKIEKVICQLLEVSIVYLHTQLLHHT